MSLKIAILGASRGLGWSTYLHYKTQDNDTEFFLSSRKIKNYVQDPLVQAFSCDFSKMDQVDKLIIEFSQFKPDHIVYCAGGGPYGFFQDQKWGSHTWTWAVNFLTPAYLLHHFIKGATLEKSQLKTFTVIGSAIAEDSPDLKASSYCAAKHALKGLILTLQTEKQSSFAIKIFSPGYMKTSMLPENSDPVKNGLAKDPDSIAAELFSFINSDQLVYSLK